MLLKDKDYIYIQKLVEEQYPNPTASEKDRTELVAEAIIYLAGREGKSVKSPDMLASLMARLAEYRKKQRKEAIGISTSLHPAEQLITELPDPYGKSSPDEDKLSHQTRNKRGTPVASDEEEWEKIFSLGEKEKLERVQEVYRQQREKWRPILPLAEYEALELSTGADVKPRLTAGIGQFGLRLLLRRARIRMLWDDNI